MSIYERDSSEEAGPSLFTSASPTIFLRQRVARQRQLYAVTAMASLTIFNLLDDARYPGKCKRTSHCHATWLTLANLTAMGRNSLRTILRAIRMGWFHQLRNALTMSKIPRCLLPFMLTTGDQELEVHQAVSLRPRLTLQGARD